MKGKSNFSSLFFFLFSSLLFLNSSLVFALSIGDKAPLFKLQGHDKKDYQLADFKGQWVVLEWYNQDCPFIKKHYDSGNMQKLQKEFTDKKVNWFSVSTSALGKQGYLASADEAKNIYSENKSNASAILLDSKGEVGQLYQAKTTPHIFIINPKGELAYEGAIDDNASTDASDIPKSRNYVSEALNAALTGKKIAVMKTKPYGCSVKY